MKNRNKYIRLFLLFCVAVATTTCTHQALATCQYCTPAYTQAPPAPQCGAASGTPPTCDPMAAWDSAFPGYCAGPGKYDCRVDGTVQLVTYEWKCVPKQKTDGGWECKFEKTTTSNPVTKDQCRNT